jgi:hypothetical protein
MPIVVLLPVPELPDDPPPPPPQAVRVAMAIARKGMVVFILEVSLI